MIRNFHDMFMDACGKSSGLNIKRKIIIKNKEEEKNYVLQSLEDIKNYPLLKPKKEILIFAASGNNDVFVNTKGSNNDVIRLNVKKDRRYDGGFIKTMKRIKRERI